MGVIHWFNNPRCSQRNVAGGKGANLGKLTLAGFPVPPGFVIGTAGFDQFLAMTGMRERIDHARSALRYDSVGALERGTSEMRAKIVAEAMPAELAEAISAAYTALDPSDGYVAVRSSGTTEDSPGASFAGVHDTFLDINGSDAVLAAVKKCWASLWNARAAAYRKHMGFDDRPVGIAVVVQAMVDADAAGVMFTANPLNGATSEIVINSNWGLGESVVSGIVTPDEFVLCDSAREVRSEVISEKRVKVVRDPGTGDGAVMVGVGTHSQREPSLTVGQLRRLGRLGLRVAGHFGAPQDVEWAMLGGKFYVLQSRDLTVL